MSPPNQQGSHDDDDDNFGNEKDVVQELMRYLLRVQSHFNSEEDFVDSKLIADFVIDKTTTSTEAVSVAFDVLESQEVLDFVAGNKALLKAVVWNVKRGAPSPGAPAQGVVPVPVPKAYQPMLLASTANNQPQPELPELLASANGHDLLQLLLLERFRSQGLMINPPAISGVVDPSPPTVPEFVSIDDGLVSGLADSEGMSFVSNRKRTWFLWSSFSCEELQLVRRSGVFPKGSFVTMAVLGKHPSLLCKCVFQHSVSRLTPYKQYKTHVPPEGIISYTKNGKGVQYVCHCLEKSKFMLAASKDGSEWNFFSKRQPPPPSCAPAKIKSDSVSVKTDSGSTDLLLGFGGHNDGNHNNDGNDGNDGNHNNHNVGNDDEDEDDQDDVYDDDEDGGYDGGSCYDWKNADDKGAGLNIGSIPQKIGSIITRLLREDASLNASTIIERAFSQVSYSPPDDGSDGDFINRLRDYVKNMKKKIQGPADLTTVSALMDFSQQNALDIPGCYIAAKPESLDGFCVSLGIRREDAARMVTVPILPGDITDAEVAAGVTLTSDEQAEVLGSVCATSVAHLFTLQQTQLGNVCVGTDWFHGDEAVKFTSDGSQIITFGPCDLDIHGSMKDRVTRSLRPTHHLFTKSQSFMAPYVMFQSMKRLFFDLFGAPLLIKGFVTDYSLSLKKGLSLAFPLATLLICFPHILGSFGKWKSKYGLSDEEVSQLKQNVRQLHETQSTGAFRKLFELISAEWDAIGTNSMLKFRKFFTLWYGPDSLCQGLWFVTASGIVGIWASNNLVEHYWRLIRGNATQAVSPLVKANVSAPRFLTKEMPKMLENDYINRFTVGAGRRLALLGYDPMKYSMLATTALLGHNDICGLLNNELVDPLTDDVTEWVVNNLSSLNTPHSVGRVERLMQAHNGTSDGPAWSGSEEYSRASNSLCRVYCIRDGNYPLLAKKCPINGGYYCLCIVFQKGHTCSGCAMVRNHFDELRPSLPVRYISVYVTEAGTTRVTRKKMRWAAGYKLPKSCYFHESLGIPFSQDTHNDLLYLYTLTEQQLRLMRRRRGVRVPLHYFGPIKKQRHLNKMESIEMLIAGTWLGEYVLSLQDGASLVVNQRGNRFRRLHNSLVSGQSHFLPPVLAYIADDDDEGVQHPHPAKCIDPGDDGDDGRNDDDGSEEEEEEEKQGGINDDALMDSIIVRGHTLLLSSPATKRITMTLLEFGPEVGSEDADQDDIATDDDFATALRLSLKGKERNSLRDCCFDIYDDACAELFIVPTYQGKITCSTGTCVPISYYLMARHLTTPTVTSSMIMSAIDVSVPCLLHHHHLREKGDLSDFVQEDMRDFFLKKAWPALGIPESALCFSADMSVFDLASASESREVMAATDADNIRIDDLHRYLWQHLANAGRSVRSGAIANIANHTFTIVRDEYADIKDDILFSDLDFCDAEEVPKNPKYSYRVIDSLQFPGTQGCLVLRLKALVALWRYIKRRCAYVVLHQLDRKSSRVVWHQRSQVHIEFFRLDAGGPMGAGWIHRSGYEGVQLELDPNDFCRNRGLVDYDDDETQIESENQRYDEADDKDDQDDGNTKIGTSSNPYSLLGPYGDDGGDMSDDIEFVIEDGNVVSDDIEVVAMDDGDNDHVPDSKHATTHDTGLMTLLEYTGDGKKNCLRDCCLDFHDVDDDPDIFILPTYKGRIQATADANSNNVIVHLTMYAHLLPKGQLSSSKLKEIADEITPEFIQQPRFMSSMSSVFNLNGSAVKKFFAEQVWPNFDDNSLPPPRCITKEFTAYDLALATGCTPKEDDALFRCLVEHLQDDGSTSTSKVGAIVSIDHHMFEIVRQYYCQIPLHEGDGLPVHQHEEDDSGNNYTPNEVGRICYDVMDWLPYPGQNGGLFLRNYTIISVWKYLKRRCAFEVMYIKEDTGVKIDFFRADYDKLDSDSIHHGGLLGRQLYLAGSEFIQTADGRTKRHQEGDKGDRGVKRALHKDSSSSSSSTSSSSPASSSSDDVVVVVHGVVDDMTDVVDTAHSDNTDVVVDANVVVDRVVTGWRNGQRIPFVGTPSRKLAVQTPIQGQRTLRRHRRRHKTELEVAIESGGSTKDIEIGLEVLRLFAEKMCVFGYCPAYPWRDFVEYNSSQGTVAVMEVLQCVTSSFQVHANVYQLVGESMGSTIWVQPQRPRHYGRPVYGDDEGMMAQTFRCYQGASKLAEEAVQEFLDELAEMQEGEYHPREDFCMGPAPGRRWYQRRIVGEGKKKCYFFPVEWGRTAFEIPVSTMQNHLNPLASLKKNMEMICLLQIPRPQEHGLRARTNLCRMVRGGRNQHRPPRHNWPLENVVATNNYHSLFFPIILPGVHSVAVVVDLEQHVIMLYDFNCLYVQDTTTPQSTANATVREWHRAIFNMVELFLNRERLNYFFQAITWGKQNVITKHILRDNSDYDGAAIGLVAWLTTWLERPPTESELQELDFSDDEMQRIKNWMAISYLHDRIWIPPVAENMVDATRLPYKRENQRGDEDDLNGWPFVVP
jgi:hypothetical protein